MGGQTLYAHRPDKVLNPASIIKISIAMDLLQWLEKTEQKNLDESLSEVVGGRSLKNLLHAMIVNSEEEATETLRNYLEGRPNHSIEETLRTWDLWHTTASPRRTTASDTNILLRGLYQGTLLSSVARAKLLNYMAEYTKDDDLRLGVLRSVLPADCRIYNKKGTLYGNSLTIAEAAIVEMPDKENPSRKKVYLMSFFGYRSPKGGNYGELENAIGKMALKIYDFTQK
jgi:beta-lactamase class A